VLVLPLPALFLGSMGAARPWRYATESAEHFSHGLLIGLRLLLLLVVLALTAITLISLIGAMVKDVSMPGLVYVFFFLDLLLAALVLLTFGRRDRRPARRRASPAAR
jgi:hypothetical protein